MRVTNRGCGAAPTGRDVFVGAGLRPRFQASEPTPTSVLSSPMTDTDVWLTEFGERQGKVRNPTLFWLSMLLLLFGITGIGWSLPVPFEFERISPLLNWGSALLMASAVYYFIISVPLGFGMLPFMFGVAAIQIWLSGQSIQLEYASSIMVGSGIGGLSLGHYAAGGVRAVLRDVQLIMIAPLWLLSDIYKRLGIPY